MIQPQLAIGPQRDAGIVLERQPKTSVGTGLEVIGGEDGEPDLAPAAPLRRARRQPIPTSLSPAPPLQAIERVRASHRTRSKSGQYAQQPSCDPRAQ